MIHSSLLCFGSEKFFVFFKTSNDRYSKINAPLKSLDQRPDTLSLFWLGSGSIFSPLISATPPSVSRLTAEDGSSAQKFISVSVSKYIHAIQNLFFDNLTK
jgi:hypothetical protein